MNRDVVWVEADDGEGRVRPAVTRPQGRPAGPSAGVPGPARAGEREIKHQRALLLAERGTLVPERVPLRTSGLLQDLAAVFAGLPVADERRLELGPPAEDVEVVSDRALLLRVLINMLRNALEATAAGGVVRLSCERARDSVFLRVHNDGAIAPEVQARVFQRSFSTKALHGRGLGTYSMKLLGERYLGGEVSFASSEASGTVFALRLPV